MPSQGENTHLAPSVLFLQGNHFDNSLLSAPAGSIVCQGSMTSAIRLKYILCALLCVI